ncbi:MAG TPA: YhfC family glutamic-type intramembrane protease [Ktedonobacterales bacterium]|jgi:uncharacterized membrane protein YhfC
MYVYFAAASSLVLPGPLWFVTASIAALFAIFYPVVLAIILSKRLNIDPHYAGYGALIFFLFQIVTRIPLVQVLGGALAPTLKSSSTALLLWLIALSLTAGLFEEVGRYVGYRWLMRKEQKTWEKALMYGAGHGGIESILLVGLSLGFSVLIGLVLLVVPTNVLPASLQEQLGAQYASIAAQPGWLPLLGMWERLWTLPVHLALSVIVVQMFLRGQRRWLWLAIGAHAMVDFVSVALPPLLGIKGLTSAFLSEGFVALFGLLALLVIRWLSSAQPPTPDAPIRVGYEIVPNSK